MKGRGREGCLLVAIEIARVCAVKRRAALRAEHLRAVEEQLEVLAKRKAEHGGVYGSKHLEKMRQRGSLLGRCAPHSPTASRREDAHRATALVRTLVPDTDVILLTIKESVHLCRA